MCHFTCGKLARIQFLACNVVTVRDVRITFEKSTVTVVMADVIGTRQASKVHIFQNGEAVTLWCTRVPSWEILLAIFDVSTNILQQKDWINSEMEPGPMIKFTNPWANDWMDSYLHTILVCRKIIHPTLQCWTIGYPIFCTGLRLPDTTGYNRYVDYKIAGPCIHEQYITCRPEQSKQTIKKGVG